MELKRREEKKNCCIFNMHWFFDNDFKGNISLQVHEAIMPIYISHLDAVGHLSEGLEQRQVTNISLYGGQCQKRFDIRIWNLRTMQYKKRFYSTMCTTFNG